MWWRVPFFYFIDMYKNLLDRGAWITFSKPLAQSLKSIEAALILAEIINQLNHFKLDEVFITHNHFEKQILLSSHKVRKAVKILIDNDLIEMNRKGVPAKNYYKLSKNFNTSIENLLQQDVKKFNNCTLKNLTSINKNRNNKNKNNNIEETQNSNDLEDYVDFNELIKQGQKIGLIGQAKSVLQSELNLLTFSDYENKTLNFILKKIRQDIRVFNTINNINTNVNDKNVLEAFRTSIKHFKESTDNTKYSISYLKSCINPNIYLYSQSNDNLDGFKQVLKNQFTHYTRFNKSDVNCLKSINKQILEWIDVTGRNTTSLSEFKKLLNNLPKYITENIRYQSVSYINTKLNELLNQNDKTQSNEYKLLVNQYGQQRAREIMKI